MTHTTLFRLLPLLLGCCLLCSAMYGQRLRRSDNPFSAGAILGVNFSQIDGDKFYGYNKPGWEGGLRAIVRFSRPAYASIELLFSQQGSRAKEEEQPGQRDRRLVTNLSYVSIPILFNYQAKYNKENDFYRWNWHGGLALSRLVDSRFTGEVPFNFESSLVSVQQGEAEFRPFELSILLGISPQFNRHLGLVLRHSLPLLPIYKPERVTGEYRELRVYRFMLGVVYNLD